MDPLRLALVGAGKIAGWHLSGLAALRDHLGEERVLLTAIADPRVEARERLADEARELLGVCPTLYADHRQMLAHETLDAAAILVPHAAHGEVGKDCLDAGLHLQMQSPLAITVAEGKRILEHARRRGRALVVAEPGVLGRATRATIDAIRRGALVGEPTLLIDCAVTILGGGFFMDTPWRHLKGLAGAGWLLDHGVHRARWFLEALGPIEDVFAQARTVEPVRRSDRHGEFAVDTEDCAVSVLRFASGALGQLVVASAGRGAGFGTVRLYGREGVIDFGAGTLQHEGAAPVCLADASAAWGDAHLPTDPVAHGLWDLWRAARETPPATASAETALEALAVIYACLEAALTGAPVRVAEVLSGAARTYEASVEAARPAWRGVSPHRVS